MTSICEWFFKFYGRSSYMLSRKNSTFEWTNEKLKSFEKLKSILIEAPEGKVVANVVTDALSHKYLVELSAMFVKLSISEDDGLFVELCIGDSRETALCILMDEDLRHLILIEAHSSLCAIHPGGNKMYQDLRVLYWWPGLKNVIANFVARCLVYKRVKVEHQRLSGLLQLIKIPQWK
ncbi:uncharacterized protein LOC128042439 [Gossypium raimondii]|uniref:uncharacterized protein LOC128042439 n=1 Tax=Gossypium raimondii TaxID=29730 RepID=UPI00227A49CB|nr:uncharacterized protein LOC128042439 [Gossypium raimondii]